MFVTESKIKLIFYFTALIIKNNTDVTLKMMFLQKKKTWLINSDNTDDRAFPRITLAVCRKLSTVASCNHKNHY